MKGDVKVLVGGSSGHIVFDEKSLIKRILMYVISAILGRQAAMMAQNKKYYPYRLITLLETG